MLFDHILNFVIELTCLDFNICFVDATYVGLEVGGVKNRIADVETHVRNVEQDVAQVKQGKQYFFIT